MFGTHAGNIIATTTTTHTFQFTILELGQPYDE